MTQMLNALRSKNLVVWTMIYLPLWLVCLGSYFKYEILGSLNACAAGHGVAIYWATHLSLVALFMFLFARYCPTGAEVEVDERRSESEQSSAKLGGLMDYLAVIRCLAFLNVFFGHWFYCTFIPKPLPPSSLWESALYSLIFGSPWTGVWMFFTLSGYLITKGYVTRRYPLCSEGVRKYYFNRAVRIFPVYYGSILIWGLICQHQFFANNAQSIDNLFSDLFFDDLHSGHVIELLWSVSTEVQFYALAPFLVLILGRVVTTSARAVGAIALIILLFVDLKFQMLNSTFAYAASLKVYTPFISNLDCFLCGSLTAILVGLQKREGSYISRGVLEGSLLLILFQIGNGIWTFHEMSGLGQNGPNGGYYLTLGPGIAALVISRIIFVWEMVPAEKRTAAGFWGGLASYGATLTYTLYVWHEPILGSLLHFYPVAVSIVGSLALLPVGIGCTFVAASLCYYGIERTFDKYRASGFASKSLSGQRK